MVRNVERIVSFFHSYKHSILLSAVIVLGLFFRLVALDAVPQLVHRDEAAIGYNAFSLNETGKDEHGEQWPLNFRSFGDYKLPGMIHLVRGSFLVFGYNDFALRFPTALAASLTLFAAWWLMREMAWSRRISIIGVILLSFSFWHISQARTAYEPMMGLLFSVSAWAAWLRGSKSWWWYAMSLGLYVCGSFIYNLPFLLLPLLFVATQVLPLLNTTQRSTQKRPQLKKQALPLVGLFVCIVVVVALFSGVTSQKTGTTVFTQYSKEAIDTAATSAVLGGLPYTISVFIFHPIVQFITDFGYGYAAALDPSYLFFTGDNNPWHNLHAIGLGNINPVLLLPFLVGVYFLITHTQQRSSQLLLAYVLLSPVVCALTVDSPNTNRLLDLHLAVLLVAAVGVDVVLKSWWLSKQRFLHSLFVSVVASYLIFFGVFLGRYFFAYNDVLEPLWLPGITEVISYAEEQQQYTRVFIMDDVQLPYIYFAYYLQFDPSDFQTEAVWEVDGFEQVVEYDRYHFENFPNWTTVEEEQIRAYFQYQADKVLVLSRVDQPGFTDPVWTEKHWTGRWQWYGWEITVQDALEALQDLPVSDNRQASIDHLESLLSDAE